MSDFNFEPVRKERKSPTKQTGVAVGRILKDHGIKVRSHLRKIVTGDEKKRIRDLIQEKKKEPVYVRLIDKISFTFGIFTIAISQYYMLTRPQCFWKWYSLVIPILLAVRVREYRKIKFQYFLIDFCYFAISLSFICLYRIVSSPTFFKICFIFSNGPLALAVWIWNCSLVFHDIDKVTSVFIHILPSILFYCLRWHSGTDIADFDQHSKLLALDYQLAALLYLLWQLVYFVKTEIMDRHKLDSNPDLVTSLRWLAKDTKNDFAKLVLRVARTLRIYKMDEKYDASSLKTKAVFMVTQFIYTCLTFSVTSLLYSSGDVHFAYIIFIFAVAVYNGACFYMEVFSKRYQLQFEKKQTATPSSAGTGTATEAEADVIVSGAGGKFPSTVMSEKRETIMQTRGQYDLSATPARKSELKAALISRPRNNSCSARISGSLKACSSAPELSTEQFLNDRLKSPQLQAEAEARGSESTALTLPVESVNELERKILEGPSPLAEKGGMGKKDEGVTCLEPLNCDGNNNMSALEHTLFQHCSTEPHAESVGYQTGFESEVADIEADKGLFKFMELETTSESSGDLHSAPFSPALIEST